MSFNSHKKFFDDEHFPFGFSRSGEFTLTEAALLERHGMAYQALHSGINNPSNEEESTFVKVCHGQQEPSSPHEKAWINYCKKIQKKSGIRPFSGRPSTLDNEYRQDDDW